MRNVKAKNSLIVGRGAKKTLKVFKPLVASSLALALGVSVGNADPTISTNTETATSSINNLTWGTNDNYKQFAFSSDNFVFENIQIEISGDSSVTTTRFRKRTDNNLNNRGDLDFAYGTTQAILNGNGNGLKIGANGVGTLSMSLWNGDTTQSKSITLDLSNPSSEYALFGNLHIKKTGGVGYTTFDGLFGGQGIKGNITFDITGVENNAQNPKNTGVGNITLKNNAGITGNIVAKNNGTYSITFEKSGGGTVTGAMTFQDGSANTTIKNLTSVTNGITLASGGHTLNFQGLDQNTPIPTLTANITTSGGTSSVNGSVSLVGNISATGGTTTFTGFSSIQGNISANGGNNTFVFNTSGSTFSMTNGTISISGNGNNTFNIQENTTFTSNITTSRSSGTGKNIFNISNGKTLTLQTTTRTPTTLTTNTGDTEINFLENSGGDSSTNSFVGDISVIGGTTSINFNSTNGILDGAVSTSDSGRTTINIADSSSGTINGNVSTPSGSIALATIVFANGSGDKSLRLNGSNNTLASITLGNGSTSTNNTLTLSSGTTVISDDTEIVSGNGLSIVFENSGTIFRNNILNSGIANINFNGNNGVFMQGIETLDDSNAVTTINITNGSNSEIIGGIITETGATNINFETGSDSKTLTLSGSSELTGITFGGDSTNNTLAIKNNAEITNTTDIGANRSLIFNLNVRRASLTNTLTNSGGNLEVGFNADRTSLTGSISTTDGTTLIRVANPSSGGIIGTISGAVSTTGGSTTISFAEGSNAKTLNLQGANNTITSITSGGSNNTLKLDTTSNAVSVGVTNAILGADSLSIAMGGKTSNKAELTLNNANGDNTLKAITLTESTSAVGENVLNLNANKTTITDNLSIASGKGMTINLVGDNVGLDSDIANANLTNLNFNGSAGTLTGAVNTTGGTTTISIANGKSGSISGAVTTAESGATTTIKFAEGDESKTLQLGQDASTITGITLENGSSSSTHNTLDLNGITTIKTDTTIGANQGLTFNFEGKNINLTNAISNTGGEAKVRFGEDNGTLTGSVSTSGGTTTLDFIQSANITNGISTNGGSTTISIGNVKTATIGNITSQNYGIGTSDGETTINFIRESTLAGAVSTTGGTTTFNLGSSNSSAATATISGAITNSATNIFNVNATTTTLKNGANGLAFSGGTNTINFANTSGSTLTWQNSNGETQNISTTGGATNINFNNNGVITGGINTDGGTSTTNIKIANGKSGTINGSVAGNGSAIINFDTTSTDEKILTLNAGGNSIKNITFGNGTEASTNNKIILNNGRTEIRENTSIGSNQGLTFNLAGDSVELDSNISNENIANLNFNGSDGLLTGTISTSNNGTTTISVTGSKSGTITGVISLSGGANNVTIGNGGTLTLQGADNQLTSVASTTSGILSLDGNGSTGGVSASVSSAITGDTTTLNFNGRANKKAEMTLSASGNALKAITLGSGAVENKLILSTGSTSVAEEVSVDINRGIAFDLENDSSFTFSNNISNASALGGLTFNIKGGSSNTNTITGDISTGGATEGEDAITTFNITDSSSGVIAGNISTKSGSTTNISFANGSNAKSLTLNGNANTITNINLGNENATDSTSNTLVLSTGNTTIRTTTSIADNQALTFDLKNGVNLTNSISNAGTANLEFNGTNGILTGTISTTAGTTTISVTGSKSGIITGAISLSGGANNVTIGNGGTLTLQGENNQLTSVSSTTSGTLSLDGNGSTGGVEASVSGAIENNTTTLNLNGTSGKKAEMTLGASGNALKAITLGSGAVENKLILSTGSTSIAEEVSVGESQALAFDLANGTTLTFTSNLSNTGGEALFNAKDSATSTINGNILNENGTNNVSFAGTGTLTLQGENNQLTSVSSTTSGTLSLDGNGSTNGVSASVSNAITGNTTTLNFNGASSKKAEMTLSASGNALKAITLGSGAVENKLILSQGSTTINTDTSIANNQALTFDLKDGVNLANNISNAGTTNLEFNGTNGILTGTLTTTAGATTIKIADSKSGTITGAVTTTIGATTNIDFASGNNAKSLTLSASGNTITEITLGSSPSTNNTLALNNGTTTISSAVSVGGSQALAFDLANGTILTFNDGLTTNATGTTTFNLGSDSASATTTTLVGTITNNGTNTFNVNSATTTLQYGASGLTFSGGANIINFENTSENGATLAWKDRTGTNLKAISTTCGNTQINFTNNGTISGGVSTSAGSTTLAISDDRTATIDGISTSGGSTEINFNGESGTLASAISTSGGTTSINISDNAVATITGNIITDNPSGNKARAMRVEDAHAPTPAKNPATNIVFKSTKIGETLSKSTLILQGSTNQITTLTMGAGENILALMQNGEKQEYTDRNATIENLDNTANGKLRLVSQISTNDANTFTINNATFSTSKEAESNQDDTQQNAPKLTGHISLILGDGVDTNQVGKESAILVASVKDGIGVAFEETSEVTDGFLIKKANFTIADEGDYKNYLLSSITTQGIATSEQKAVASAFMLDYNLYMANLNSLNRRMGELRENAHSQGIWARVFNGGLSNEFGLGSKSNYTTIQAGYDYAFGSEGANNYLGFALSYALSFATSDSKAIDSTTGKIVGLDNIYSNAVEVALYNSYVSDSGWYNDTIAKFSYIMSSFDIYASGASESRASDTKNYALTLSDEVGYAIRLGEMSEWSITPQVEATFGYFSQSDFKQTLSDNTQYLDSKADSVLTLRARAGSAFTYDFKNFTQKDTFNASVYVGAFYEYDYVSGGDISMVVSDGTIETQKSDIRSDGRVVMNVGTNMSIQDNTRLYFDFEKSFMGKINTDYQVNFGVRYSFGESDGYTPMIEKAEFKAPLKIEGEDKEEEAVKDDKEKQGEKKEEIKSTKDKSPKTDSKESETSKDTRAPAKAQPKEKPSK